jgi:nucleoside-diphosphate-sugar epimerase
MNARVLVTGASGFIGRALVEELSFAGHRVRAAMRQPADVFGRAVEVVAVSDLTRPVEWRLLLKDIDTVVHLAGIAHAGAEIAEEAYDRINRIATAELAAAARAANIRRLVFISSIRAQSGPTNDHPLTETDPPHPTDAYGRSKLAAEEAVRASNVPFTILRPVLVYGPNAKGNLDRLIQLARSPWPVPFGSFTNRRSLLARQNLIAAIRLSLEAPRTIGETYIVADPTPLTPAEIISALRTGLGRSPWLVPVPPTLIAMALNAIHRPGVWERLGGEMVTDPTKLLRSGWHPPIETRAGLAAMVQATSPRKSGTASLNTR